MTWWSPSPARLEADQDRAGLVVRVHDDRVARAAGRLDRDQVPASARRLKDRLIRRVPLAVDRYALGPIGTNCYVVRAEPRRARGGRRRPGRRRGASSGSSSPRSARACAAILVTHAPLRPHRRRRRPRRGHRRARLRCRERELAVLEQPERLLPRQVSDPALHAPSVAARGRRDARARRRSRSRRSRVPGHSPGHLAFHADGCALLRRRPLRRLGRPHRPARSATGTRCSTRSARSSTRFPPETVVYPGHGPATTLGAELARNPFLAELRARAGEARGAAARHARRPPGRAAAAGSGSSARWSASARSTATGRSRRPCFEDTELFARTSGEGSDVVQKEMYTFTDRSRPLADAAAGGDGADLPRLRRARPAPRAAAAEALHDRADVPLRRARPRAATASTGSSRSRRSAPTTRRSTPS